YKGDRIMQQAIMGKEKILMFRRLADTKIKNASKLALQVTHTLKYEREQDIQQTKDGGIVIGGGLECELELEAVSTRDELNEMLEKSVINEDRKSTRLNSSHVSISYAVFCLKKKNININNSLVLRGR